jgi:deferrochelatase/peroxidase EfeB
LVNLPRGIYWDHGATPPRCYGIAFLRADQSAEASQIHAALSALAMLWDRLRNGETPTLSGAKVPSSAFEWLLGFGKKAFGIYGSLHPVPRALRPPNTFNSIDPMGGGVAVDGTGLNFAPGIVQNLATEEFCVQFTADTPLAVARALVETSLMLESLRDQMTGRASLLMSTSFTGFNREDHRSWIDFHDGVSNLRSGDERRSVIETKAQGLSKGDKWLVGGTFMAFIRLRVDIRTWRKLDMNGQECPSSNDLRLLVLWKNGVSGSDCGLI